MSLTSVVPDIHGRDDLFAAALAEDDRPGGPVDFIVVKGPPAKD